MTDTTYQFASGDTEDIVILNRLQS